MSQRGGKVTLNLVLAGVGVFLAWQVLRQITRIGEGASRAHSQAVESTSNLFYNIAKATGVVKEYDPNGPLQPVLFPNGQAHLIDMQMVNDPWFGPPQFVAPPLAKPYSGKLMRLESKNGRYYATGPIG